MTGALLGDIQVVVADYDNAHKDQYKGDYFRPVYLKSLPFAVQARGSDAEMQAIADKMRLKANEINFEQYDYKVPIGHVQNCHTVARILLEAGGIKLKIPMVNDKPVWMAGVNGQLDKTFVDLFIKKHKGGEL